MSWKLFWYAHNIFLHYEKWFNHLDTIIRMFIGKWCLLSEMIENLTFFLCLIHVHVTWTKERKNVCVCWLEANYYCCVDILDFLFTRNTSNRLKSNKIYFSTFKFTIITIWHNVGTPRIYWQTKLDSKLYFPLAPRT